MHRTMSRHYHRDDRPHHPFFPGLFFLFLLVVIFKGWFFVLLLPFVFFAIVCAITAVTRAVTCEKEKRKNDDFILNKRKNDGDRRFVQTQDGEWVEIV